MGKYQVISVLGQGAMGVVLKAHDPTIERDVAIKVLAEHLAADATALGRFLAEAKAVGRINHPNVMAIYEICQEGPIHYLVLEYVAGGSVDDRLTERKSLSVFEATQVLIDACKGVGAAHAAGLIHRDIKPANFMRTADGTIKVADFGLAKAAANSDRGLTQVGMIVGTPLFMSPEQCQAKSLDHRSDIYSLGATYYTLLTGKDPYQEAENVTQLMYLHCHGPIPRSPVRECHGPRVVFPNRCPRHGESAWQSAINPPPRCWRTCRRLPPRSRGKCRLGLRRRNRAWRAAPASRSGPSDAVFVPPAHAGRRTSPGDRPGLRMQPV